MCKEKKNLSRVFFVFSGAILLFTFLLHNSYSYSDNDLSWHIRVGQDIIFNREAPSLNYYNHTLQGQWIDHEWLLNAAMAVLKNIAGFDELHLAFALVAMLAVWIACLQAKKEGALFSLFAFAFLAIWASRPHLGIRVQEFGLLFTVFLIYTLRKDNARLSLLFILPLLFILWANIHGSFLLGLTLLGAYTAYLWLGPLLMRIAPISGLVRVAQRKEALIFTLSWILSFAATFINPYGYRLYSLLAGYADTTYMDYIQEWLGQHTLPLYYPQLIYLALVAALVVFHVSSWKNVKKHSLWEYGLFLIFYILAWRSRRHFPLFAFLSLPLVVSFWQDLAGGLVQISAKARKRIYAGSGIILLISSVLVINRIPLGQDQIQAYCEIKYPCKAVAELSRMEGRKIFNEFNWGGYILYAAPSLDIFIDGRMPQERYGDWTILEEYRSIRYGVDRIVEDLDRHGIDAVIVYTKIETHRYASWERLIFNIKGEESAIDDNFKTYLDESPDWHKAYSDSLATIYEKKVE